MPDVIPEEMRLRNCATCYDLIATSAEVKRQGLHYPPKGVKIAGSPRRDGRPQCRRCEKLSTPQGGIS